MSSAAMGKKVAGMAKKPPKAGAAQKMAGSKGKSLLKKILKIAIPLLIVAIIGVIVYFVFFNKPKPKTIVKKAIACAQKEQTSCFRPLFTNDSIVILESSWSDDDHVSGSWSEMMVALLTPDLKPPKIVDEKIHDNNGVLSAEVTIQRDLDEYQIIYLRQQKGLWRITINVPVDPEVIELPEACPKAAVVQRGEEVDNRKWWEKALEEDEEEEKPAAKKGNSKISKYGKRAGNRVMSKVTSRLRRMVRF